MKRYFVRRCPKCGGRDIRLLNFDDCKFRVACFDCGHSTAWHLNDPELAIMEWKNLTEEKEK